MLKHGSSKLFEEAAKNVSEDLVGKLVQSNPGFYGGLVLNCDEPPEPVVALVVKVVHPTRQNQSWNIWSIDLLIGEKVVAFSFSGLSAFFDQWQILE